MAIVDKSYFTGKLKIPNIESQNTDVIVNDDKLEQAINKYEFIYLRDALGFEVAKNVINQITSGSGSLNGQAVNNLVDGYGSWQGLKYEISNVKYSQVANFIFCNYLIENQSQLTEVGNVVDEFEKSKLLSSWNKYNIAWQEMMQERQELWRYDGYYYENRDIVTLREYLAESDDFNTNYFKWYQTTNKLGL